MGRALRAAHLFPEILQSNPCSCGAPEWLSFIAITYTKNVHGVASLCVCAIGAVANTMNLIVLTRRDLRAAPVNKILSYIALADMLLMLEYIPFAFEIYLDTERARHGALYHFQFWFYAVLVKLVPCLLLTVLSVCLIRALLRANRHSQRLFSRPENVPMGVLGLLSGIYGPCFFLTCYQLLGEILDMLALLNSAVNFILYCAMSRQFRVMFCRLFIPGSTCSPQHAAMIKVAMNAGNTATNAETVANTMHAAPSDSTGV
ncbi:hypothetical protein B566_EDAN006744 [Ephemera danica]|nr:hypothetical protein B566_EDAN006744 [Ephemera danica]